MTITVSQISSLVGRYTNSIINEQANLSAPLVGEGKIKKLVKPDKIGIVNIKSGELSSTVFIGDAGTLPTGSDVQPVQATYSPVGLFSRLSIPRMAANLATSLEDGIDLVKEEMDSCGKNLGRALDRGIIGSNLGTVLAQTATTSTTFEVTDPSPWRKGMAFAVYNGSTHIEGDAEASLLYVTNVAMPADGVGNTTITFVGTSSGGNSVQWEVGYTFYFRGQKANAMTTLGDITAASSLYSVSNSTNEWSGNLDSSTTTLSLAAMRALSTTHKRRRGKGYDFVALNSKNEERYSNQLLNNRRFVSGKMDGVGGAAFEFEGKPLFVDENIGDSELFYITSEDIAVHVFRDFAPDFDGEAKKGMNRGAVLVSDTSLIYDVQVWGAFNLRVERRNGTSRFSALTA